MFVRLTRRKRVKAGWLAALLYLFCVLAPGAALALGDAASCLVAQSGTAAAMHEHEGAQHAASHRHHEMQADMHATHHADAGHTKHQHDGKGSMGPCCAVLCVSAIAADLPAVEKPSQPRSICVSENLQRLPGEAPPLLYRPPIA
jgi:ABC-type Zn2+ transport system substrate-binding protein/surface adhesin